MKSKRTTKTLDEDDAPYMTSADFARLRAAGKLRVIANNDNRVKVLRARLNMSQAEFARSFDLSLRTVQEWEQGRHKPDRIARNLLRIIAEHPTLAQKTLTSAKG